MPEGQGAPYQRPRSFLVGVRRWVLTDTRGRAPRGQVRRRSAPTESQCARSLSAWTAFERQKLDKEFGAHTPLRATSRRSPDPAVTQVDRRPRARSRPKRRAQPPIGRHSATWRRLREQYRLPAAQRARGDELTCPRGTPGHALGRSTACQRASPVSTARILGTCQQLQGDSAPRDGTGSAMPVRTGPLGCRSQPRRHRSPTVRSSEAR
jgi:hypothetical protein